MLKIKHTVITETSEEIVTEMEMTPKYFWSSRSVYAVEFIPNQFNKGDDNDSFYINFIEVEFEDNIIRAERYSFSKLYPLNANGAMNRHHWVKELFHAYMNEDRYYDYRSKEQFDKDFNNVITKLSEIRN